MIHLNDGSVVGGYYGPNSYATTHPRSGDLYVEELWTITAEGHFAAPIPDSKGAVFRSEDYIWLEFLWDRHQPTEAVDGGAG